jgi:F-type H+-transporting ATPase subunit b
MILAKIFLAINSFVLLYASSEPHDAEQKDTLLSINPGVIIWTVLIFTILLLILKKWAWKPLLASLNNRELMIRESVEKAEELKRDAERMLNENKKILEKAENESRRIINEGKEYAEKVRGELMGKAQEDANRMINQAKSEIERQKVAALNELKDEVTNLAVRAAEIIIDENLDEKKQKKIVEKFIEKIPKN